MGETLKEMYRAGLRRSLPDFKPRDGHRNDTGRVSVLDVQRTELGWRTCLDCDQVGLPEDYVSC